MTNIWSMSSVDIHDVGSLVAISGLERSQILVVDRLLNIWTLEEFYKRDKFINLSSSDEMK